MSKLVARFAGLALSVVIVGGAALYVWRHWAASVVVVGVCVVAGVLVGPHRFSTRARAALGLWMGLIVALLFPRTYGGHGVHIHSSGLGALAGVAIMVAIAGFAVWRMATGWRGGRKPKEPEAQQ